MTPLQTTPRTIGLRDIARAADVDVATVSRSLRDGRGVSTNKAKQIKEIARNLGYRPRPIRTRRAGAIGLLIASDREGPDQQFLSQVIVNVERALSTRSLNLNVAFVPRTTSSNQTVGFIEENRVDGVLIAGHPPASLVRRVRDLKMPVVAINDTPDRLGVSCARSATRNAVREGIVRLAAWGHKRIGLAIQNLEFPTVRGRFQGWREGLVYSGIDPDECLFMEGISAELDGGREAIDRYRKRGELPTAILFENDWMAIGAIQQLQHLGLSVPRDVSIIGFGDLWICEQFNPSIVTIRRSIQGLLEHAIDILLEEIETGRCKLIEKCIPGEVVWRDSAAPPQGVAHQNTV